MIYKLARNNPDDYGQLSIWNKDAQYKTKFDNMLKATNLSID